jgi:hypothetical protein
MRTHSRQSPPIRRRSRYWSREYKDRQRGDSEFLSAGQQKRFRGRLKIELSPEEMRLLSKTRKVDQEAYDEYLKARFFVNDFRKESLLQAIEHSE